jgi:exodeoxyribonuclease VII large subunit
LITSDPSAYEEKITNFSSRLMRAMTLSLNEYSIRLGRMTDMLSTFDKAFSHHTFTVEHLFIKLHNAMAMAVEQRKSNLSNLHSNLLRLTPDIAISRHQDRLMFFGQRLIDRTDQLMRASQTRLEQTAAVLDTLSPLKTLARGYSIVSKKAHTPNGSAEIITSTSQVEEREEVEVRLHQGAMDCRVVRKKT